MHSITHAHAPPNGRLLHCAQGATAARWRPSRTHTRAPCGLACGCLVVALVPRALGGAVPAAPTLAAGMTSAAASSPISYLSAATAAEIDEKLMGNMGYSLDQLMVSA